MIKSTKWKINLKIEELEKQILRPNLQLHLSILVLNITKKRCFISFRIKSFSQNTTESARK